MRLPEVMRGGVFTLVVGSIVAQVVALAATPLLSRLYAPGQLAALTQLLAVSSVLAPLSTMKLEVALMLPRREAVAGRLFGLAVLSGMVVAAMFVLVLAVASPTVVGRLVSALPPDLRMVMPAAVLSMTLFIVLSSVATREGSFARLATARAVAGIVTATVGVLAGWLHGSTAGLVWALPLGQLAGLAIVLPRVKFLRSGLLCLDRLGRSALGRYRRYPLFNGTSSALDGLRIGLPAIALGWYCTDAVVGQYGMTFRLAAAPITLVALSVGQVNLRAVSGMVRARENAAAHVRRTLGRLWVVAGIGIIVSMLFGPAIFSVVLGPEWRLAGEYLVLLAPGLAARFVSTPISTTLGATEHVEWEFTWRLVAFLAVLATLLLVGPTGEPRLILASLSGVEVVLCLAMQVLAVKAARSPRWTAR